MKIFFAGSIRSGRKLLLGCEAHGNMAVNVLLTLLVSIIWNELFSFLATYSPYIMDRSKEKRSVHGMCRSGFDRLPDKRFLECGLLSSTTPSLIETIGIIYCYYQ